MKLKQALEATLEQIGCILEELGAAQTHTREALSDLKAKNTQGAEIVTQDALTAFCQIEHLCAAAQVRLTKVIFAE